MSGSVDNQTPRALTFFFGHLKYFSGQSLRSQFALEPIHKTSVLLLLSLRPDASPKLSNNFTVSSTDCSEPSKMSVVSSAY